MNSTIYMVAFFKTCDGGIEYGFKRLHFKVFYSTLALAEDFTVNCFSDDAGWYNGAIIEEKREGTMLFIGTRVWYLMDENGDLKEVPNPDYFNNVVNII